MKTTSNLKTNLGIIFATMLSLISVSARADTHPTMPGEQPDPSEQSAEAKQPAQDCLSPTKGPAQAFPKEGRPTTPQNPVKPSDGSLVPLERFPPEYRALVLERIRELSTQIHIDWDSVQVGINERDEVVLRAKDSSMVLEHVGTPTCWGE